MYPEAVRPRSAPKSNVAMSISPTELAACVTHSVNWEPVGLFKLRRSFAITSRTEQEASHLFREYVLMLSIANRQRPFPVFLSNHKLKPVQRWIDRDERNTPVVILARGYRALPFSKVEHRSPICTLHIDIAQLLARIFFRELGHLIGSRRHHQPFSRLRQFRLILRGGRFHFLLCLRLPIEDHFQHPP